MKQTLRRRTIYMGYDGMCPTYAKQNGQEPGRRVLIYSVPPEGTLYIVICFT